MAFVAIYDACVLHPPSLRDLLIRLANKRLLQAKWSTHIVDECLRSIQEKNPRLTDAQLGTLRAFLSDAAPDCLVNGYEPLIAGIQMKDPDDRHVVAAAIRSSAQLIVTFNTRDFPADVLAPLDIEVKHPDDFVIDQIHLDPGAVIGTVQQQANALKNPPLTIDDVLNSLERIGLVQTVTELRRIKPR
jgi:predicted nucleic acid-binding protein